MCDAARDQHAKLSANYFKELEHLRRGVEKMLEQCASFMNPAALGHLAESLELEAKYVTKCKDDTAGFGASNKKDTRAVPAHAGSDNPEEVLRQQIEVLEGDILDMQQQNDKLRKDLENKLGGARARASLVAVAAATSAFQEGTCQTEPVDIVEAGRRGSASGGAAAAARRRRKARKGPRAPGEPADESEEEEEDVIDPVTGAPRRIPGRSAPPQAAGDPSRGPEVYVDDPGSAGRLAALEREVAKAQDERNAADDKLKSAEEENVPLEDRLKHLQQQLRDREDATSATRRKLDDAQNLVSALERQIRQLSGKPEVEEQSKTMRAKDSVDKTVGAKKKAKEGPSVAERKGITRRLIVDDGPDAGEAPAGDRTADANDAVAELVEEEEAEEEAPGGKVDQCVGNGPGPGMSDMPVLCRGRRYSKLPSQVVHTATSHSATQPSPSRRMAVSCSADNLPPMKFGMARTAPDDARPRDLPIGPGRTAAASSSRGLSSSGSGVPARPRNLTSSAGKASAPSASSRDLLSSGSGTVPRDLPVGTSGMPTRSRDLTSSSGRAVAPVASSRDLLSSGSGTLRPRDLPVGTIGIAGCSDDLATDAGMTAASAALSRHLLSTGSATLPQDLPVGVAGLTTSAPDLPLGAGIDAAASALSRDLRFIGSLDEFRDLPASPAGAASTADLARNVLLDAAGTVTPSALPRDMMLDPTQSSSPWSAKAAHRVSWRANPRVPAPFEVPGHAGGHGVLGSDPEPYLLQVWEQCTRGHKKPPRRELQVLGALAPLLADSGGDLLA